MTIALSANTPRISYTVNQGVTQTSFAVPFVFFTTSTDLNVFVDNTARTFDASTSNTTLYTVSGGDGSTGTVTTTVTGATGGSTVVITRAVPLSRTTDFPSSGAFEISKLNTELDTVLTLIADADDENSRALRLKDSDSAVDLTLPLKADRVGTVLGFNATTGAAEAGPTIANVNSLSAITANINTVAGISANVTTVAGIEANVTTVAGISSNVTTVAGQTTNLQNVTDNLTAIQNASTNATNASNSASAAAASATAAALSADNFDDTYLGAKSSDPSVDNDGDALNAGDLYFNTTSNNLKVYTGSAWADAALTSANFLTVANNLSDLNNAGTARTNLGLGTIATQAANSVSITGGSVTGITDLTVADGGTGASSASAARTNLGLVIGTDVQAFDADIVAKDTNNTFTAAQRGSTDTDTTNTGNVTLNFDTNQNFVLTLTGNVTLDNPSTEAVGQSGFITFIQDATGGRSVSLGTDYETAGGSGLTLSSAASTTDIVPYVVVASSRILLGAPQLAFS